MQINCYKAHFFPKFLSINFYIVLIITKQCKQAININKNF